MVRILDKNKVIDTNDSNEDEELDENAWISDLDKKHKTGFKSDTNKFPNHNINELTTEKNILLPINATSSIINDSNNSIKNVVITKTLTDVTTTLENNRKLGEK